jgi:hypothetical protein
MYRAKNSIPIEAETLWKDWIELDQRSHPTSKAGRDPDWLVYAWYMWITFTNYAC